MEMVSFLKTKAHWHLASKYDTNKKKKKRQAISGKKDYSVRHFSHHFLTTAREMPKIKRKNPDKKMCQLIFWKIYPQPQ